MDATLLANSDAAQGWDQFPDGAWALFGVLVSVLSAWALDLFRRRHERRRERRAEQVDAYRLFAEVLMTWRIPWRDGGREVELSKQDFERLDIACARVRLVAGPRLRRKVEMFQAQLEAAMNLRHDGTIHDPGDHPLENAFAARDALLDHMRTELGFQRRLTYHGDTHYLAEPELRADQD